MPPILPPSTMPVVKPTVATIVVLLVHVPPVVASVSVTALPSHTAAVPSIGHPSIVTIVGHANVDIDTSKVVEVKLSVTAYAFSVFTDSDFYHHRWPRISKLES